MLPELTRAVPGRDLTGDEVAAAAAQLLDPTIGDAAKADFLRAWARRGETPRELAFCARAFLPQALDPGVHGAWRDRPLLDCCGTGGGGLNLINLSTGMMFVLAALGIPVVKHGNRGVTKRSGSADVLEALGIRIDLPPDDVARCLEAVGCAFLFAPAYHTTFAALGPARRALAAEGRRTVFNLLGPLLNPAEPEARLVGVFRPEHVDLYRRALEDIGCPRFTVAYGRDRETGQPIGEISAHGPNQLATSLRPADGADFSEFEHTPSLPLPGKLESLLVRDARESAARLEAILSGRERGLGRETLLVNAAFAAWTQGHCPSVEAALAAAAEALDSGAALKTLRAWQTFSAR